MFQHLKAQAFLTCFMIQMLGAQGKQIRAKASLSPIAEDHQYIHF
jgi:hypothetical protein